MTAGLNSGLDEARELLLLEFEEGMEMDDVELAELATDDDVDEDNEHSLMILYSEMSSVRNFGFDCHVSGACFAL